MKRAPIKILLMVIITGIICVLGQVIISVQLNKVSDIHNNIMDEYVTNRDYMNNIKALIYEHQAVIANRLGNADESIHEWYENREDELRTELTKLIIEFSYRMKGGDREKIYHKVYSDFAGYENNADTILDFINNGEIEMAIYYNYNVLKPFLEDIDSRLDDLDKMVLEEIESAEDNMAEWKSLSDIFKNILIGLIVIIVLLCTFFCFRITTNLDKYKKNLEEELIEKNKSLQEKNAKMIRLQDDIIVGMANLIESRNGETGEHVKRTSVYVEMIAKSAKEQGIYDDILTDEYIEMLKKAAPLHDVGKITISDTILLKPSKLTQNEFEEIKLHAPKGDAIIRECFASINDKKFVDMACDVAGCHHEKWDGNGYSNGLKGEDIPLSARIMAIADVFDALISERCYKKAFSIDKAYEIIEESSGTHFDPKLVQVFVSLRSDIEKYINETNAMMEKV